MIRFGPLDEDELSGLGLSKSLLVAMISGYKNEREKGLTASFAVVYLSIATHFISQNLQRVLARSTVVGRSIGLEIDSRRIL